MISDTVSFLATIAPYSFPVLRPIEARNERDHAKTSLRFGGAEAFDHPLPVEFLVDQ